MTRDFPALRAMLAMLRAGHLVNSRESIASIALDQIVASNVGAPIAVGVKADNIQIYSEAFSDEHLTFPIFVFGRRAGVIEMCGLDGHSPPKDMILFAEAAAHVLGISWERLEASARAERLEEELGALKETSAVRLSDEKQGQESCRAPNEGRSSIGLG